MAARLDALGDNHVHASPGGLLGGDDRAYLMANLTPDSVHTGNVGGRVAPEERHHRHPFFDTDGYPLFAREMQEEVHPKRLVGQLSHAADCLTQQRRRVQLRLHDPQAAPVADGGHQFRATHVGTHRGTQDGEFDTQEITESGV